MATIFVIDDEPVLLDLICQTLRLNGHEVLAFRDGITLFESISATRPAIDLLLTDIEMKPIGGFEVAKRLHEGGFAAPVLFMSGYMSSVNAFGDCAHGSSLLEKPFTASQLREAVSRALSTKTRSA